MNKNWIYILLLSVFLVSCSEFNTVVKSTDYEYKYKKALEYYNDEDYGHAVALFQDLVYVYRGTSKGDELYYYYAKSSFEIEDYLLSANYYKSIIDQYPRSQYAEEAQYMIGVCYYENSPGAKLDQGVSRKAIDALQLYINMYPYGENVDEANILIDELNEKIVYKSYLNARLYYDMDYYKASVIALENALVDYPDTGYREELKFLLFKSKYLLGIKSVEEKKKDRLNEAYDEYFIFVDEFPESDHMKEVERNFKELSKELGYDIEVDEEEESEI